ncbi:hypothetical protein WJX81_007092 [Elliptochloris bilobata]|uniref:Uncharacterized protein n=1 Tax=Elliptochloris bilobata TaxID=381761 RepID=A0AAW1QL71_9CHLO
MASSLRAVAALLASSVDASLNSEEAASAARLLLPAGASLRLALAVGDGLLVTSGCLLSPGALTLALHMRADMAEGAVMAAATPTGWQAVSSGRSGGAAMLPAGVGGAAAALCVALGTANGTAGGAPGALQLYLRNRVADGSVAWATTLAALQALAAELAPRGPCPLGLRGALSGPSRKRRARPSPEALRMHTLWLTFRSADLEARYARWHSTQHCWLDWLGSAVICVMAAMVLLSRDPRHAMYRTSNTIALLAMFAALGLTALLAPGLLARRREAALTCATIVWCMRGLVLAWRLAPGSLAAPAEGSILVALERMALVERLAMSAVFFQVRFRALVPAALARWALAAAAVPPVCAAVHRAGAGP